MLTGIVTHHTLLYEVLYETTFRPNGAGKSTPAARTQTTWRYEVASQRAMPMKEGLKRIRAALLMG